MTTNTIDRITSCARTAETHSVLAVAAAVRGDYVALMDSALNAREAADEAIHRANQVLPVNQELREIANKADLEAATADAAVKEFESRAKHRRDSESRMLLRLPEAR